MRPYNSVWFIEYWPNIILAAVIFFWWMRYKNRLSSLQYAAMTLIVVCLQVFFVGIRYIWIYGDTYRFDILRQLLPPQGTYYLGLMQGEIQALTAGWAFAVILLIALYWIFLRRPQSPIDRTDAMLLVLGVGVVGWPAGLIFFAVVFLLAILGMIWLVLRKKKTLADRLIITPFIFPAMIVTLLLRVQFLDWSRLEKIRF